MREIKFRGKTMLGDWVYGSLVYHVERGKESRWVDTPSYRGWSPRIYDYKREYYYIIPLEKESPLIPVVKKTIGQYTGLCDKHDQEIYEGDLLVTYNYDQEYDIWTSKEHGHALVTIHPQDGVRIIGDEMFCWDWDNEDSVYSLKFLCTDGNKYDGG